MLVLSRKGYLACLSIVVSEAITSQCDTIYKRAQGEATKLIFCVTVRSHPKLKKEKLLKEPLRWDQLRASAAGTEHHRSIYSLIYISLEIFLPLSLSSYPQSYLRHVVIAWPLPRPGLMSRP